MDEFNVKLEEIEAILDQHFHWQYQVQLNRKLPNSNDWDMVINIPGRSQQDINALKAILAMAGYEVYGPTSSPADPDHITTFSINSYGVIGNDIIGIHWCV